MRRNPALAASIVACVAAFAAIPGALAGSSADPGISPGSILLGTTASLTGEGADGAAVGRGVRAYFAHVNARGGVAGRRFAYAIADDGGDPATTEEATRQLVEEDEVFAIVAPAGTEQSLAARRYLNAGRVPQLFVASGATTWGTDRRVFPWSIGFQPSYQAEGWVYGRYVARALERAKVAVLYKGEGRDLLRGLQRGLAGSGSKVVAALPYGLTASVQPEVVRLRASGANVLAVFAAPSVAAQAYSQLRRSGWKPRVLVNADAATVSTVPEGSISLAFLKDPADPQWKDDPGMRLYRYADEAVRAAVRTYATCSTCTAWRWRTRRCRSSSARSEPDSREADGPRAFDHERREPVPPSRSHGAHLGYRRLPRRAGPAATLHRPPLDVVRRALARRLVKLDDAQHLDRDTRAERDLPREPDRLVPIWPRPRRRSRRRPPSSPRTGRR